MSIHKRKSCQLCQLYTILFGCLVIWSTVDAQTSKELEQGAFTYLQQHTPKELTQPKIHINSLPTSAKTPTCEKNIAYAITSPKSTGNVTVSAECSQPKWRRLINAQVTGLLPVLIASQDIGVGENLSLDKIKMATIPSQHIRPHHLTNPEQIEQSSARHFIPAGTYISVPYIKPRLLVTKGNQVRLLAGTGNFQIEMAGTAMESGELNKQITAKNNSSGKIVKGTVIAADTLLVP